MRRFLALCLIATSACQLHGTASDADRGRTGRALGDSEPRPLAAGEQGFVLRCAKVFTLSADDSVFAPGMLLVREGRIEKVGEPFAVPAGFETIDLGDAILAPGLVDLHSHIQTGGWGDINDMVLPVNPEFRTSPTIVPGNRLVRVACAGGVTTLFAIPGSGTSMSGFGVLYKTQLDDGYEEVVLADPGGLKVAQDSNPQRDAGDLGVSRGALAWILEDVNEKALAADRQERYDPALENLKKVHNRELPILIHTAGSDGITNTARMWRGRYPVRSVLSHGCFDAWKTSPAVIAAGLPSNNGPRTIEYTSTRDGKIHGIAAEYLANGAQNLSLNTDAPVMPEHEFALQGAMSARYGADPYTMLRALTIHPAIVFGIDDRVGSLEPGKDADIVAWSGIPLDPRSHVERVWIDGQLEYDKERDGQIF